jgi:hypothetical protein
MVTNQAKSKRGLKPFRQFIRERFHHAENKRAMGRVINEEAVEMTGTATAAIILANDLTPQERQDIIDGFAADIADMSG